MDFYDIPCHFLDTCSRYVQGISEDPLPAESPFARVFFLFIHVPFNFGVAAALFYLAELVEEYTVITAKVIKCTIAVSIIKLKQSVNFK